MTLLQAIGEWFEEMEVGTLGVDLYLDDRPSRPVALTALYLEEGQAPDVYCPVLRPTLRCVVRDDHVATALERAEAIYQALHRRENVPLGDDWWCTVVLGRGAPHFVGRAAGNGVTVECAFNLSVRGAA